MSEIKFQTMKHIENVRNFLGLVIKELLNRGSLHDQSKLESPEAETFEEYTPKLKKMTYGSNEYKKALKEMTPCLEHHYANNRHHPEHFNNDVSKMNIIDIIEMLCDWKAATLRHNDGDIYKSIQINKERFNLSEQLTDILINTAKWLEKEGK